MINDLTRKVAGLPSSEEGAADCETIREPNPRAREEIEELKARWLKTRDKWPLELTEGFEDHRTELTVFRLNYERTPGHAGSASVTEAAGNKEIEKDAQAENKNIVTCPIGILHGQSPPFECMGPRCGWWSYVDKDCAIAGIANSLDIMVANLPQAE